MSATATAPERAQKSYENEPLKEELFTSKAALGMRPMRAKSVIRNGKVFYEDGTLFLALTNVIPGQDRKFDWDRKITIALSAKECSMIRRHAGKTKLTIYHDPDKGKPTEGTRGKYLNIEGMDSTKDPGKLVYMVSLSEGKGATAKKASIALDQAAFNYMQDLAYFAIPVIKGY